MKRASQISLLSFFLTIVSCSSFLNGQNQNKTISKENIKKANRLIPQVVQSTTIRNEAHPLSGKINRFLKNQDNLNDFKLTGLKRNDYLEIIEKQVRAMLKYQNSKGRIIDPVEKVEKYYTTPCFAHSIAVLAFSGKLKKTDPLFESGVKALTESLNDMVNNRVNGNHGDFYTWPVMLAYENFKPFVNKEVLNSWNTSLKSIDISKLYAFYNKEKAMNWILVHASGEFLRAKNKFTSHEYVERMLGFQLSNFTNSGMYNEGGNPLSYDLFARHYLAGVLQLGYKGKHAEVLQDNLWRGAWTSMFLQSPFGELPAGYRSSHHIWNEAEQCVLFEIYASAYSDLGKKEEAGAFKRAAMLSLNSIKQWIREDGSGYVVKNRFPIENKHGYERYSVHTCYNMLATSMLAQAWQFSNDEINELPAPSDIGGFVIPILKPFHKIFANANGTYLEYETNGDQKYNPTGIIRSHIKGGHPQLGPSNGIAPLFSGENTYMATGPLWENSDGTWSSLAELKMNPSNVEILEENTHNVEFKITYDIAPEKSQSITEIISIKDHKIIVETEFKGFEGKKRISWPMLTNDGKNKVKSQISDRFVELVLQEKNIRFSVIQPQKINLISSDHLIKHVNGMFKGVFAEFSGNKVIYTLE
ncbi:hypothetical protein [Aquimarina algiphila]|uniref:hypothetical protein n=1 Tax=Aquimarina algiphila TaxID=2047982 RepID=UPI002330977B|nr:hypothetical protein [Aquimarina algiphila]